MIDERTIREMVRRVVLSTVRAAGAPREASERRLVTQQHVEDAADGRLDVPRGSLVTPLARQTAMERGVTIVESPAGTVRHGEADSTPHGDRVIALAADHGGFEMKAMLERHLNAAGHTTLDCGTDGTESVDYPDFALAAAQLVVQGRAWRAIVVDGAGIGSCMAANKVPGVRAAMCYDEATAVNSREHNHANVLTLGAGLIGDALARRIVDVWLETAAGGGRHASRVDKIRDIERRYLKG
jgi:ribose 5-phosphate isomerase B